VLTGLAFTGAAVFWAGAAWAQSRWLVRFPRHRVVVAGALILASAVALAIVGTLPSVPAATAAPSMVVAAIGMGLLAPSLTLLSLHHTPPERQGYASSAMQTTQNLGQIVVLGVASALLNAVLVTDGELRSYGAAFTLLLLPTALVVILAGRARENAPTP
jgi:MFS family permease